MAAVTTCSDFGAPRNKVCHCFHCFPICLPWSDGTGYHETFTTSELSVLFYSTWTFRISPLGAGGSRVSGNLKRTTNWWAEDPGYTEALQERAGGLNVKGSLLVKENQISQVKEFSAFLCLVRCKSLGSLNSSRWQAPQLVWGECPVFPHPERLSALPGERPPLKAVAWQAFLLSLPRLMGSHWPAAIMMIGMFFVYWFGGKQSISHDLWPCMVLLQPWPSRPSAQCSRSSKYLSDPLL